MALIAALFLLAAFAATHVRATEVIPCESGPAPTALKIAGCPNQPCTFPRGSNQAVEVEFPAVSDSQTLTVRIMTTTAGVTTEYPLPSNDACTGLTRGDCPLTTGESLLYSTVVPIQLTFPVGPAQSVVTLLGDNYSVQTCFIINAVIT